MFETATRKDTIVTVRIDDDTLQTITEICNTYNLSRSKVLYTLINEGLKVYKEE